MKRIKLTQGKFALVSDKDYSYLNQWKWYALKGPRTYYAVRHRGSQLLYMHRAIKQVDSTCEVDHRDGNGLNNRRSNLRICSARQNQQNRQINTGRKFKGVYKHAGRTKPWQAKITVNGRPKSLGYYVDACEAAKAYNKAARRHFGSFARLNKLL